MKTKKFFIDEKVTIWIRHHLELSGETDREIIENAKKIAKDPQFDSHESITQMHEMYETMVKLTPDENQNNPTLELFECTKEIPKLVYSNYKT